MKNKNNKHHHVSIHQRIERLSHHNIVLSVVVSFMLLGFIKYETRMLGFINAYYSHGFGVMTHLYEHHDEVTRMQVQYGSGMRYTTISGL
jgi:uncharacterized membrane protein YkgB